jgi:hypothetical protein
MVVQKMLSIGLLAACASWTGLCAAADATPLVELEQGIAQQYGGMLLDKYKAEVKDPQIKFEGDPDKAVGLFNPMTNDGIIVIPVKNWKEDRENKALDSETGVPMCYLFLSTRYNPLVDGKPIDDKKLRKLKFMDDNGNDRQALALLCTVKHVEGDDYRLQVYGADKKPIVEAQFGEATDAPKGTLAIAIKEPTKEKATLAFTIFEKYGADLTIAHKH